MIRSARVGAGALVLAALCLHSCHNAEATVFFAANDGVDSESCGALEAPCRSITRALVRAVDGDEVRVGPGVYGDLNGDGVLGGEGEERSLGWGWAWIRCELWILAAVAVESTAGATATTISLPGDCGVLLAAPGARLGRRNRGFTIKGTRYAGVLAPAARVRIEGNVVLPASAGGISVWDGAGTQVRDNVVLGTKDGDWSMGISATGAAVVTRNRVAGSVVGISTYDFSGVMQANTATDNDVGFRLTDPRAPAFRDNSAIGNRHAGIRVVTVDDDAPERTVELFDSNAFGNGDDVASPTPNCGLVVENAGAGAIAVIADGFYWGAPGGPGPGPADAVCAGSGAAAHSPNPAPAPWRAGIARMR